MKEREKEREKEKRVDYSYHVMSCTFTMACWKKKGQLCHFLAR